MPRRQRRELIRYGRRTREPATALRFQMVAELGAGRSKCEVARRLSVATSTVVSAAKSYMEHGVLGLFDRRCHNGHRKVDDRFLSELYGVLRHAPHHYGWQRPTWTRELLCKEMTRRGFEEVAVCTMGRALRLIGARRGRAKPIVRCPWPRRKREAQLRKLDRLAAAASRNEPVYYVDEVDIDLNPRIGSDWMLRGEQRRIMTPGKNQKHYVAGALHGKTRRLVWVEHARKSSALFCKLLFRLAATHRSAACIHLIADNYIIHKSCVTRRALRSLGHRIKLHFLPPYCPDANPIERVWLDLHANVTRNHQCRSMSELGRNVVHFLEHFDGQCTRNPALQPQRTLAA